MCKLLLIKNRNKEGYMKAKPVSMGELWDVFVPNPLAEYEIPMVR